MIWILMRHLPTAFCDGKRYCGRVDCPILPGACPVLDADILKRIWAEDPLVFVSPLLRCVQTAEAVRKITNCRAAVYVDFLMERGYGIFDGMEKEAVIKLIACDPSLDFRSRMEIRPPGGESALDVRRRTWLWLNLVQKEHHSILLITHQGVLREIYAWLGRDFRKFSPGEVRIEAR